MLDSTQKRAFTMIELVFVIVILGILAATVIPKLSATRDDAKDAKDCNNIATCVEDMVAEYTAKQSATKSASLACVNAENSTQNSIVFTITADDITVSGAPAMCDYLNTTIQFGGANVSI